MDSEFDTRWRMAGKPFDGVTVSLSDFAPLSDLRQMLIPVVEVLHAHEPEVRLFSLKDWHEHDGFVKEASPTTWQQLRALLVSENALKGASTGDTYVRTGFFPERRDFLLRIYVPDIYDNPFHAHDDPNLSHCGIFDLTAQEPLALRVQEAAQEAGAIVSVMPAREFFDRNYSG
ncbi:MAG: hypothetical protein ACRYFS_22795 [Janthinobacterium lividum]